MRKSYLYYRLAVVALLAVAFQSCKKDNSINNTTVIATPYSLYFSDSAGTLYNTNDGVLFKPSVFPADGVPSRAILIAGPNLLWVKYNAHVSTNDGVNFNPTYTYVNPFAFNQTVVLNANDEGRVYIASSLGGKTGIVYSDNNAAQKSWHTDASIDTNTNGFRVTSYTQLKNGTIIAYDFTSNRLFSKDNKTSTWVEQKTTVVANRLPAGHIFSVGHYNNTVVAVDLLGGGGYFSDNKGADWAKYTGLPARPLYIASSPFDAVLMVGTDSMGVYILKGGTFVSSNAGLGQNTTVRAITSKENIYVNGVAQQFVYIATNQGIYRSQDLGQNWTLVRSGNYYAIY